MSLSEKTLYFLRDQLHDQVLEVSTPDFRQRAQLVIDALNELDAEIEDLSLTSGDSIPRGERAGIDDPYDYEFMGAVPAHKLSANTINSFDIYPGAVNAHD